ncbi:MAG: cytochrome c [Terracidiphilus sp.]|nr:cytochrome c [Terracidiphilus sp.]
MRWWLSAVCIVLLFGQFSSGASRSQRERGAQVFVASGCLHCHTVHNVGGHKGPNLSSVGRTLTEAQIRVQILRGGNEMPPFADDLEPAEVTGLVAYLRSCREKLKR